MSEPIADKRLAEGLRALASRISSIAEDRGFAHDNEDAACIALMHSELSEALEGIRHRNPKDQHCTDYGNVEVELADCIIRILDFAHSRKLDVAGALFAKVSFNAIRPWKHGGKAF